MPKIPHSIVKCNRVESFEILDSIDSSKALLFLKELNSSKYKDFSITDALIRFAYLKLEFMYVFITNEMLSQKITQIEDSLKAADCYEINFFNSIIWKYKSCAQTKECLDNIFHVTERTKKSLSADLKELEALVQEGNP